jgi:pyruvate kinase
LPHSLSYRKTKIVATIGPACSELSQLKELIQAGLNVARLNFSHGTFAEHKATVEKIRKASEELAAPVGILQDLQGPKIRILGFEGEKLVKPGDLLTLTDNTSKDSGKLKVDIEDLHKYVKKQQSIFIDDGIIELQVESIVKKDIFCKVIHGGILRPRKGVNLPDADLPIESMTEKDIKDLEMGAALGFDYVALSFVRSSDDIIKLKKRLEKMGRNSRVIAKIEKKEAIINIESIIDVADGIMVARGDLSVEIGQVHLPTVQKRIISICNKKGKPVITATQMLDSMQVNSRPTRAEITDVANAVLDGSDALMLSGETAFGKYPTRSIQTMHDIISEVEKQPHIYYRFRNRKKNPFTVPESIAISAVLCAKQLEAKVIVCLSTTGKTAQMISKYRPKAKLIAVTAKSEALCKLELCWGVQTLKMVSYENTEDAIEKIEALLVENKIIKEGDDVVLTLGLPVAQGQTTNAVRVFTLGKSKKTAKKQQNPRAYRFIPI